MDEIMNEVTMETVKNTVDIIPAATPAKNWHKAGVVGAVALGIVGLAAGAYYIYTKIAGKNGEQGATIDNVEVAKHDFLDETEE